MDYQSVVQNPMEEFEDLTKLEEGEEDEEEEHESQNEKDVEMGGNMRPSLLFTPSVIKRRGTVYNLHQVRLKLLMVEKKG